MTWAEVLPASLCSMPGLCTLEHGTAEEVGPSTYLLFVYLVESVAVEVGSLGVVRLDGGMYGYVGSAKRAVAARLRRHFRRTKPFRWHIDYLTANPRSQIPLALVWSSSTVAECELVKRLLKFPGSTVPVPSFGASDCKQGCAAHLIRLVAGPWVDGTLEHLVGLVPPPKRVVPGDKYRDSDRWGRS